MPLQYIDLSERHGHRDDHGFVCGAEFNVKIRRRINIPDFVREKLSQGEIDEIWWEEAGRSRDALKDVLSRRYKWIGELAFVGRGPGWLAIEDTACRPRNWDTIGKVVDQHLKEFIKSIEAPSFWRDIAGVDSEESKIATRHHAKKRQRSEAELVGDVAASYGFVDRLKHGHRTKKSPAQLQREIDEVFTRTSTPRQQHAMKKQPGGNNKAWYVFYIPQGRMPKSFGGKSGWDWPKAYFGPYESRAAATSAVQGEMAFFEEPAARYKIRNVTPQEFIKLWGRPPEKGFGHPWSVTMKRNGYG